MASLLDTPQISAIVAEIDNAAKAIQDSDVAKDSARKRALAAAKDLVFALERPIEMIYQHAFGGPDRSCVRLAINLRIFHLLAAREARPISAEELASLCGAEHLFIVRIMRVLTTANFVQEAGEESYVASPATKAMTVPAMEAAVKHTFDHAFQVFPKMPAYFETRGYKCPADPNDTPFQYAFGTRLGFYEYLEQDSKNFKDFDTFMTASKLNRPIFANWFPVQERIIDGFDQGKENSSVLMVDIGGGLGHDLERFKRTFPQAGGRLILQDLARTVADALVVEGIEAMAYDFFTPQPVKAARTYFFHHVLHNWPDCKVKEFLENTVAAMTPNYSKLILNEYILPATNCPRAPSWADIHMMTDFSACERSEKQWRELLGSVGLQEVTFWLPPDSIDGVIEAVLGDVPAKRATEIEAHSGRNGRGEGC